MAEWRRFGHRGCRSALLAGLAMGLLAHAAVAQGPPVFSGPQPGERLPPLPVRLVYGDQAGAEVDLVQQAGGKPLVLIFIHQANRPSIGMTRLLTGYTVSRAKEGLATGVVWLDDDLSTGEQTLKRIAHAMTREAPTGISLDGKEGPGAYGLNRNVTLTILVAEDNRVTANFALTQPSVQADLPKVLAAVVDRIGGDAPKVEALMERARMARGGEGARMGALLRRLAQSDASPEEIDRVAKAIEAQMAGNRQLARRVAALCKELVDNERLDGYSRRAQRYVRAWASRQAAEGEAPADADGGQADTGSSSESDDSANVGSSGETP